MNMLKLETTGDFALIDPISGVEIGHDGVTEDVPETQFIRDRIESGELRVVEDAPKPAPKPHAKGHKAAD